MQSFLRRVQVLAGSQEAAGPDGLSRQERRILALVVEGKTNRQIGSELELSDKTVKTYLSNAFQKLRANRRSQAAALYARMQPRPEER